LGGTFSIMLVPQLNDVLIGQYGWRNTWLILAFSVWAVLILPSVFVVRNRPEEMGLLPDWNRSDGGNSSVKIQAALAEKERRADACAKESWTAGEARRTAAFWKLLAVGSSCSLVGTGLVFHQVSLLGEQGVSRQDALGLLGVQAMVGTVMSLFAGYLTDRVQARYLLLASTLFLAMALGLLAGLPSPGWAVVYAGLLGLQGGIIRTTGSVVWINFFGRLHQGSVRGLAMSVMVIAAAFGPLPLALSKDYLGSYTPVLYCFLALPLLSAVGILSATQPVKRGR